MSLALETPLPLKALRYAKSGVSLLIYGLFLAAISPIQRLPLRLAYKLASWAGDLVFLLWPKGRRNAIENVRHVLGPQATEDQVRRTAKRSFRNYMKVLVDFLRLPRTSQEEVRRRVRVKGWEHLDSALQKGKGALLVGLHLGSWDLAGIALAARGYEICVVAEKQKPLWLNRLIRGWREAQGVHIIFIDHLVRPLLQALKRNQIAGIIVDRPLPPGEGVEVSFFGQKISWPPGPAAIALHTGAPLLVGYLVRTSDDSFEGEILPPVEFQASGDRKEDLHRLSQIVVEAQEQIIQGHLDQWYMFRRMWPQDESDGS